MTISYPYYPNGLGRDYSLKQTTVRGLGQIPANRAWAFSLPAPHEGLAQGIVARELTQRIGHQEFTQLADTGQLVCIAFSGPRNWLWLEQGIPS